MVFGVQGSDYSMFNVPTWIYMAELDMCVALFLILSLASGLPGPVIPPPVKPRMGAKLASEYFPEGRVICVLELTSAGMHSTAPISTSVDCLH